MRWRPLSGLFLVLLSSLAAHSLPSAARAGTENLLPNPSFDDGAGLTGWDVGVSGSWALGEDGASCGLSSAADGQSAPSGGGDPYLAMSGVDCLPLDPVVLPELWLGAIYKTSASVNFRLHAAFFSDTDCSNFIEYSPAVYAAATGSWNGLQGGVTVPANAAAFRFQIDFNPQVAGLPPFEGSVDELYAGPEPPIFVNGFEAESGSLCGWNASVP